MTDTQHADESMGVLDGIADRIRAERTRAGISQRELARRLGVSASLISQLECGLTRPSVGTLYAIVTEFNISLDHIIRGHEATDRVVGERESSVTDRVVRPWERERLDLASGVRWEQLLAHTDDGVDFLHATYEVGGASTPRETLMRHEGREYGYVVSGTLGIQIGFDHHELNSGDAIAFDSTRPHRLFNKGDVPVHAIWFIVGGDTGPESG